MGNTKDNLLLEHGESGKLKSKYSHGCLQERKLRKHNTLSKQSFSSHNHQHSLNWLECVM